MLQRVVFLSATISFTCSAVIHTGHLKIKCADVDKKDCSALVASFAGPELYSSGAVVRTSRRSFDDEECEFFINKPSEMLSFFSRCWITNSLSVKYLEGTWYGKGVRHDLVFDRKKGKHRLRVKSTRESAARSLLFDSANHMNPQQVAVVNAERQNDALSQRSLMNGMTFASPTIETAIGIDPYFGSLVPPGSSVEKVAYQIMNAMNATYQSYGISFKIIDFRIFDTAVRDKLNSMTDFEKYKQEVVFHYYDINHMNHLTANIPAGKVRGRPDFVLTLASDHRISPVRDGTRALGYSHIGTYCSSQAHAVLVHPHEDDDRKLLTDSEYSSFLASDMSHPAAHEFAHILGLDHMDSCAGDCDRREGTCLMNSMADRYAGFWSDCSDRKMWEMMGRVRSEPKMRCLLQKNVFDDGIKNQILDQPVEAELMPMPGSNVCRIRIKQGNAADTMLDMVYKVNQLSALTSGCIYCDSKDGLPFFRICHRVREPGIASFSQLTGVFFDDKAKHVVHSIANDHYLKTIPFPSPGLKPAGGQIKTSIRDRKQFNVWIGYDASVSRDPFVLEDIELMMQLVHTIMKPFLNIDVVTSVDFKASSFIPKTDSFKTFHKSVISHINYGKYGNLQPDVFLILTHETFGQHNLRQQCHAIAFINYEANIQDAIMKNALKVAHVIGHRLNLPDVNFTTCGCRTTAGDCVMSSDEEMRSTSWTDCDIRNLEVNIRKDRFGCAVVDEAEHVTAPSAASTTAGELNKADHETPSPIASASASTTPASRNKKWIIVIVVIAVIIVVALIAVGIYFWRMKRTGKYSQSRRSK